MTDGYRVVGIGDADGQSTVRYLILANDLGEMIDVWVEGRVWVPSSNESPSKLNLHPGSPSQRFHIGSPGRPAHSWQYEPPDTDQLSSDGSATRPVR